MKLSLTYSKQQMLRMYLNSVYYGNGYWGVHAAARGYFHAMPARLTWGEAAMLAGLLQAPSLYDPETHYALGRARQQHVLSQLVVNHYLTRAQAGAALAAGLPLRGAAERRSTATRVEVSGCKRMSASGGQAGAV